MNAARWQCNLHPSATARVIAIAWLVVCGGALWWSSWPDKLLWIKVILQGLMLWEGRLILQRLAARQGRLEYESMYGWRWQGEALQRIRPMRWLPWGVLIVLRSEKGKIQRWWLMHDNMPATAWRKLRALCLQQSER